MSEKDFLPIPMLKCYLWFMCSELKHRSLHFTSESPTSPTPPHPHLLSLKSVLPKPDVSWNSLWLTCSCPEVSLWTSLHSTNFTSSLSYGRECSIFIFIISFKRYKTRPLGKSVYAKHSRRSPWEHLKIPKCQPPDLEPPKCVSLVF